MGRLVGLEVEGGGLRWVAADLVEEVSLSETDDAAAVVRMASGETIRTVTPFDDVCARVDAEATELTFALRERLVQERRIVPFSDRERALLLAESDHLNGPDARVTLPVIRIPLSSRIRELISAAQRNAIRWIFGTDLSLLFSILLGTAAVCGVVQAYV